MAAATSTATMATKASPPDKRGRRVRQLLARPSLNTRIEMCIVFLCELQQCACISFIVAIWFHLKVVRKITRQTLLVVIMYVHMYCMLVCMHMHVCAHLTPLKECLAVVFCRSFFFFCEYLCVWMACGTSTLCVVYVLI